MIYANTALQSIFWPQENARFKEIMIVISAVILLGISARISIPLQPVPLTFQSAAVIFLGMILGTRLGTYTLLAYLAAGFSGAPVFAHIGTSHLFFGPTFGYLIGFVPAAALCGYLAQKGFARHVVTSFIAACLGAVVIFSFGLIVLSQFIGWTKAIELGLMPFMVTEMIKLFAASLIIPRFWKPAGLHKK